jgi:hypothetical protein
MLVKSREDFFLVCNLLFILIIYSFVFEMSFDFDYNLKALFKHGTYHYIDNSCPSSEPVQSSVFVVIHWCQHIIPDSKVQWILNWRVWQIFVALKEIGFFLFTSLLNYFVLQLLGSRQLTILQDLL